jgi:hypothetical protein
VALLSEDEHVRVVGRDVLDPGPHERAQLLLGRCARGDDLGPRVRAAAPSGRPGRRPAAAPCCRCSGRGRRWRCRSRR